MLCSLQLLCINLMLISSSNSWDLSTYNISSNYYISSITTYAGRAFLALPRSSCFNNNDDPTLVEVSWFSAHQNFSPRRKPFFIDSQTWNNCDHLQDVISLDVETMRARLWVLDKGNENCAAKLIIYNLFQKINYTLETPDVPKNKLNFVIVDVDVKLDGPRAYVGLDGMNYLLVFSLNEFKWWKINLHSENNNLAPISTKFLALARKELVLFMTGGKERGIFSLELTSIRKYFTEDIQNCNVTYLGEKLGDSSGLVADLKDGLIYYLPRDYVVVRWDTRSSSQAEHYNILAQSYEQLPYVSQLYTGPQNGIWALVNMGPSNKCDEKPLALKRRLVKLLKYNIFM